MNETARRVGVLLAVWVILTGLLIAIGVGVVHSATVTSFDHRVTSTVVAHRTPALNAVMKAITWLGSWVALVTTGVILLVLAARRRLPWLVVAAAVVAWAGEASAVTVAKHVVQRERPPREWWLLTAHGWSWPSGHAATAAVVFSVLAFAMGHIVRSDSVRWALWAFAILAVAAVAFSRIELGVHWTTDVIASIVFVFCWLLSVVTFFSITFARTRGEAVTQAGAAPGIPRSNEAR